MVYMQWSGVGHTKQKAHFEKLYVEGHLAHAYLLAGPEMIGKRMVAEDIVRELVGDYHMSDVLRIAPTRDEETGKIKDIAIEEIRDLNVWISRRPLGAHKCILIDSAERLGTEAANTLLKILEEPPAYAHFFLITGKPGQVMGTITSRCERVDFQVLTEQEMVRVLGEYKSNPTDATVLAIVAAGKPGLAVSMIKEKKLPMLTQSITDLGAMLKAGIAERLAYAKKLSDNDQASDIVSWWLAYTHARLGQRPALASLAHGLLDLSYVLSESRYNRRLAIEHFLLTSSVQE